MPAVIVLGGQEGKQYEVSVVLRPKELHRL
uniref:GARS_N domain-containing protein n=1 Tax=Angiostrongylus cantonensis TaxID=6313 RepID=A0A0K0DQ23_ANGCA